MSALREWLQQLGLAQYFQLFSDNEVDMATLAILSDEDLKELGLPFGPRKRIRSALSQSAPPGNTGERRQLTVLFCDMAGFTAMASRLDPEVLQVIVRQYEEICEACVLRFDGHVFQRLGDGIVAFFGFPVAHERSAERAIRAAQAMIETLSETDIPGAPSRLEVRIGIATGMVVVASGTTGAVGETMNLASRLQGIAPIGGVAVSENVRQLTGDRFQFDDLGPQQLKGIERLVRAYLVTGLQSADSQSKIAQPALSEMVGRDTEVRLLCCSQEAAAAGTGQIILLTGEPGIGKSRILHTLRARWEAEGIRFVTFRCSPFYANSAFYPFVDHFERLLNFSRSESGDSRLSKLEVLVAGTLGRSPDDLQLLAAMMLLPYEARLGRIKLNPQTQKERTIQALVDWLRAKALSEPTVVVFEDLHWADPTTLEVLRALAASIAGTRLLALLTARPEFEPEWGAPLGVAQCALSRLNPEESIRLIHQLAGGNTLPPDLLQTIVERTDGIPLFIEEVTKMILESGDLELQNRRYVFRQRADADILVPPTLRDALMARLDRLGPAREIAQIGAAIGREFSYELLAAVAPVPVRALDECLLRLTDSGLAASAGSIPHAVYTFKHALVQDTAYDSLLKSRRQQLHGQIGAALSLHFKHTVETEPELVAHHYTAAAMPAEALPLWRRAGQMAIQRFALREGVAHLKTGLSVIQTMPPTDSRRLAELDLRSLLGPSVMALYGWGVAEVSEVLEPAWSLAEALGHRQSYLPIIHSLWVHYLCRGQLRTSLLWGNTLLQLGESAQDEDLIIMGHRAVAGSYYWLGEFTSAKRHGDLLRALYDGKRHWHIADRTNVDPLSAEGNYRCQYLWMMGYPDLARTACLEKDAHALQRNHPFDLAFALTLGAQVFDYLHQPAELWRRTVEAERLGREHRVPLMSEVMAEVGKGICWLQEGSYKDGAQQLEKAIQRLEDAGHGIWIWYLWSLWAQAIAGLGRLAEAMEKMEYCVASLETREERVHFAEVLRVYGWLLFRSQRTAEAEHALRRSIAVAQQQDAKSWELRSTMTLAELLASTGDAEAACDMLSGIYHWFEEGLETKDLLDAKDLLLQLNARRTT